MADANRTEPGTQHRREEARKEGQIARARDLPGAVALLAAIGVMSWFGGGGLGQWRHLMAQTLEQATTPNATIGLEQFRSTFELALLWSAVVAGVAWICGTAVAFQGGFLFSPQALFKPNRLLPHAGFSNMFSLASLSRTGKSIVPVLVMAWFTWSVLASNWGQLVRSGAMDTSTALAWMLSLVIAMAWRGGAVLLAWAVVDYFLQKRSHENSLKMTKQEVKEDNKETQGNPETRGRIKRIQRTMHRRRMMQQVPHATVVVTNPTHFAVALRYDPQTMAAPVVVAKGRNLMAARIRRLAVFHGVPIVENRPLARALFAYVEIGMPIPGKLYAAVAEILAFLQRQARWRAG